MSKNATYILCGTLNIFPYMSTFLNDSKSCHATLPYLINEIHLVLINHLTYILKPERIFIATKMI